MADDGHTVNLGSAPVADTRPHDLAGCRSRDGQGCYPGCGCHCHLARQRHVLLGDLDALEYAIADYVAKWGEQWTGRPYLGEFGPDLPGLPTAVANMAMTVIRKNIEVTQ